MHNLEFTAADNAVGYRVVVSGALKRTVSTDKSDFVNDHAAMGTVGGGKDAYRYDGRKLLLETNDLDGLLVSINGSAPEPARNFNVARQVDFSQEFGSAFAPASDSDGDAGDTSNPPDRNSDRRLAPPYTPDPPTHGGSPSIAERIDHASRDDYSRADDEVTVVSTGPEFKHAVESIEMGHGTEIIICEDGVYDAGAVQNTLIPDKPMHGVAIIGNFENPLAVELRMPVNLIATVEKNEHVHIEGIHFARRSQFAGQFIFFDCVFSDLRGQKPDAVSGKPVGGDFRRCDIGHPDSPDKHAAIYYGGGLVYFCNGCQFHATESVFDARNNVEVQLEHTVSLPDVPLFDESYQVQDADLERGLNVFKGGKRALLSGE